MPNLLETLASGLLNYSRSEPEGLLARGLRQPAGLLGRGLNNAINMQGPGLLAQQDAFFRPSVMNTPEQTRAQGAAFLQNIASGPLGFAPLGWTAFHGSPHKFDKFDFSKIGSGEGAQAYGWGGYFADAPEVAKSYQTAGAGGRIRYDGRLMNRDASANSIDSAAYAVHLAGGDKAVAKASGLARPDKIDAIDPAKIKPDGNLYRVDIDDARAPKEAFLDWDKPLSQQSERVKAALRKAGVLDERGGLKDVVGSGEPRGQEIYEILGNRAKVISNGGTGAGDADAAAFFRRIGIPGIRYLDAGSRASGGTYNTVLFDDSLVKILERQ